MTKKEFFLRMQDEKESLFPPKENYFVNHTANGKNIYFSHLPDSIQRGMRYENMHLMTGMRFENGMPVVNPYNGALDFDVVSFTDRARHTGIGEALHL